MAVLARNFTRILLAALVLLAFFPAFAQESGSMELNEQKIKAGLVYNFLKYIEWPIDKISSTSSVSVCLFGMDAIDEYLEPMHGRSVNRRTIAVRHIYDIQDAGSCNLLFVNGNKKDDWPRLREFISGKSILTVSDFPGFISSGGMIEFGRKENRINVDLNMKAVSAARLHVYDRLLRLVTVMR